MIKPANTIIHRKRAVVLMSGGLDSATILALTHAQGLEIYGLSFDYGQNHTVELARARKLAQRYQLRDHRIVNIDMRQFGGSALLGDGEIAKPGSIDDLGDDIPLTYVPARNTVFLSFALAWAEVLRAPNIYIGVNALDYSGYPDCRPTFIDAMSGVANTGTRMSADGHQVIIHTPLLHLRKSEIITLGLKHGVDYAETLSCYDPSTEGLACGQCDACVLRAQGFVEAGVADPTHYQHDQKPKTT